MTLSNQDIRLMSKADWGPSTGFPHFPPAPILLQVSLPSISAQGPLSAAHQKHRFAGSASSHHSAFYV